MQLILRLEKFLKFLMICVITYLLICLGVTIIQYFQELSNFSEYEDLVSSIKVIYLKSTFRLIISFIPVVTLIFISLKSILNEKSRILSFQDQRYEMFITQGYFKTFGLLLNNLKIVMIILLTYTFSLIVLFIYNLYNEMFVDIFFIEPDISRIIVYGINIIFNILFFIIFLIKTSELYNMDRTYRYLKLNGHLSDDNNYIKPVINLVFSLIIIVLMIVLCFVYRVSNYYGEFTIAIFIFFITDFTKYALLIVGPILVASSFVTSKKFQTSDGLFTNNILETLPQLNIFLIFNFASIIIYEFLIYDGDRYYMNSTNLLTILIIICSIVALIYNIINLVVSKQKNNSNH